MSEIEIIERSETAPTTAWPSFWTEFDRFFGALPAPDGWSLRSTEALGEPSGSPTWAPAFADVTDRGDAFEITADVPGIPKEKIEVRVTGQTVDIRAEHANGSDGQRPNYLRRERRWTGFRRAIEFPEPVRADGVQARYENGVLTVTVPKTAPVVERKVAVQ